MPPQHTMGTTHIPRDLNGYHIKPIVIPWDVEPGAGLISQLQNPLLEALFGLPLVWIVPFAQRELEVALVVGHYLENIGEL